MAEEQFAVAYVGTAVEDGLIPVSELAPSLLALADAVQATHQVLEAEEPAPQLHIRATRQGSFDVDLVVVEGILEHAMDVLTGRETTAGLNLYELITVLLGGFGLVRWLRDRRIRRRDPLPNGWVRITGSDGTTIDVPPAAIEVASDRAFRTAARAAVTPLNADGIDAMTITFHEEQVVEIVTSDLPAFDVPDAAEEEITDFVREVALSLRTVNFVEGNKWRVYDGDTTFNATVADLAFLSRVERNEESFTHGDLLQCRLRTRQWRSPAGLRSEHTIEKVIDHIRAAQNVPLPFEDPDE